MYRLRTLGTRRLANIVISVIGIALAILLRMSLLDFKSQYLDLAQNKRQI